MNPKTYNKFLELHKKLPTVYATITNTGQLLHIFSTKKAAEKEKLYWSAKKMVVRVHATKILSPEVTSLLYEGALE